MRHYEIVALVHPDQSAQIDEIVTRYVKIVEDSGGKIHRQENWGRRKLAYPINKIYKADYFLLNVECEPSVKDKIENDFKYFDSIIRSLCIRKDQAVTEPSPILKKLREQEEERAEEERKIAEQKRLEAEEAAKAAAEQESEDAADQTEEGADDTPADEQEAASAEADDEVGSEEEVVAEAGKAAPEAEEATDESETESEEEEVTT